MSNLDVEHSRTSPRPLAMVDKAAFFRFVQQQPELYRYEYVRGRIMQQMAGGTRRHVRIASRFIEAFSKRLDPLSWFVMASDLAVDTGPTIRYADVVVEPLEADPGDVATDKPVIVVEVLSKSSEDRDLYIKPAEYLSIETLRAYIVASQDEPLCFVWTKDVQGRFPVDGIEIRGSAGLIEVPLLSSSITLAEIYAGLLPDTPKA